MQFSGTETRVEKKAKIRSVFTSFHSRPSWFNFETFQANLLLIIAMGACVATQTQNKTPSIKPAKSQDTESAPKMTLFDNLSHEANELLQHEDPDFYCTLPMPPAPCPQAPSLSLYTHQNNSSRGTFPSPTCPFQHKFHCNLPNPYIIPSNPYSLVIISK